MAGGRRLQSAATTGNGTPVDCRGLSGEYSFSIEPSGTVSGGAVQFEEAPDVSYGGTWAPIGDAVSPATGTLFTMKVAGNFRAIRGRISSDITGGGSVTVRVEPPRVE